MYAVVKKAFSEKFGVQHQLEELIVQALEGRLDASNFQDSTKRIHEAYEKTKVDEMER